ncbi:alkaline phosphatase D family protein [Pseudorhodoferax soli]|uniref:Alkaline phosphatase D n=1 Tax=Pseudorhodoferax soli TaxID=545864 RepID=A0A368Y8K3_9BURK|nr:alkaline phosphatase D family protein [Pseudorhodoferax soli]RCW75666.1 alkaline phosphatase D [Pseudorhodoferax soli]
MKKLPAMVHPLAEAAPTQPGRRRFVRQVALGAAALGGLALAGCGGSDDDPEVAFAHGVASGDPLADRVILWTRVSTAATGDIVLRWEVATDSAFANIVASGETRTAAARDHTVKVDATGLSAGRSYWYRFNAYGQLSPVGRTRTLPAAGAAQVRLAVFSCANYPAGYFNVYAEAAKRNDLDATVHLGDYIYEYARGGYASADAAALGRLSEPATETVQLADYRRRYAQYRGDADLQALHAAVPMIAVWDDHEISNDTWRNGAENHQPDEGDFGARKAAAVQAYHEWMPIRSGTDTGLIYRSFDFGGLLALHMLDTRTIGRDEQLSYTPYITQTGLDAAGFSAAVGDPARQLLGSTQAAWLGQQMAASTATWQVLGQQVLMGRMQVPAPLLFGLLGLGGVSLVEYSALATKAATAPQTLTPQELAVLQAPAIPYNLDAWDGYPAAREAVLEMARSRDKNLVVLAGDTHNAWASDLLDAQGGRIGVEFATSSVTSPGFEDYLPGENPAVLAGALTQLVGPLQYCDTARRGYMVLTATATECRADWTYVDTIASRSYQAVTDKALRVLPGAANRRIVAV